MGMMMLGIQVCSGHRNCCPLLHTPVLGRGSLYVPLTPTSLYFRSRVLHAAVPCRTLNVENVYDDAGDTGVFWSSQLLSPSAYPRFGEGEFVRSSHPNLALFSEQSPSCGRTVPHSER